MTTMDWMTPRAPYTPRYMSLLAGMVESPNSPLVHHVTQ